jgi:ribonuclease HI
VVELPKILKDLAGDSDWLTNTADKLKIGVETLKAVLAEIEKAYRLSMEKKEYIPTRVPNNKLFIHIDGASLGNPGPSGIGIVVENDKGEIISECSEYIGEGTNNQAEYQSAISALQLANGWGASAVELYTDSELLARQLQGIYKVKDPILGELHKQIKELSKKFQFIKVTHIPRERNVRADLLSKAGAQQGPTKTNNF